MPNKARLTMTTATIDPDMFINSDGTYHGSEQSSAVGRDAKLAARNTAIQDADYQSKDVSLFDPVPMRAVRVYDEEWVDVSGQNASNNAFGRTQTFRFGHEGGTLYGIPELHLILPAPNGVGGSNLAYQAWIGETVLEKVTLKYGSNILREYSGDFIHAFRRIMSELMSLEDEAYKLAVGQVSGLNNEQVHLQIPIWVPWGDKLHNHFPMIAASEDMVLQVKFRDYRGCIRADQVGVAVTVPAVAPAFIDAKLRCHYVHLERAERSFHVARTLAAGGVSWTIFNNEVHEDELLDMSAEALATAPAGDPGSATKKYTKVITEATNPVVFVMATSRFSGDVAEFGIPLGSTQTYPANYPGIDQGVNDLTTFSATLGTSYAAPERQRLSPILMWALREGARLFTPKFSWSTWELSMAPKYFKHEARQNIACIPFSRLPREEHHGLGHLTIASLSSPTLELEIQQRPGGQGAQQVDGVVRDPWGEVYGFGPGNMSNLTAATPSGLQPDFAIYNKRIDHYYVTRNRLHLENSEVLLYYR